MAGKNKILKKKMQEKDVYKLAVERARYIMRSFDKVVVSLSGGKDSTATLHVALDAAREQGKLPLDVYFFDEEVIPPDVDDYIRRLIKNKELRIHWICAEILYGNVCSSQEDKWVCWDSKKKDLWVKPPPPEGIFKIDGYDPSKGYLGISKIMSIILRNEPGRVAMLLGIRAQESLSRFRAVSRKGADNYIVKLSQGESLGSGAYRNSNIYKAYPIYDWSTNDVWTAPKKFGWDYCTAYDKMEMAGLKLNEQRLAPPFGTYPARSLWTWQVCWPEMWDKIINRVHGARTAAMYATGPLYGKGGDSAISLPSGMTWQEYLKSEMDKIDDKGLKDFLAKSINQYVKKHYRKTDGLPILAEVMHPDTGVSWSRLVAIVIRKDKDGRMNPSLSVVSNKSEKYRKMLDKYFAQMRKELHG